jgi:hypothetical protein
VILHGRSTPRYQDGNGAQRTRPSYSNVSLLNRSQTNPPMTLTHTGSCDWGESRLKAPSAPQWEGGLPSVLLVLIPASACVRVHVVGTLYGSDILFLALLPYVLWSGFHLLVSDRFSRRFLLLCTLWLAGQVLSDLIQSTPFADYARGWSNIGLTLTNVSVLYILLYRRPSRVLLYALGIALGGIDAYFINPGIYAVGKPWEFGYGPSITLLVVEAAALLSPGRRCVRVLLMAAISLANLYYGSREQAGFCFVAPAALLLERNGPTSGESRYRASPGRALAAYAAMALAGVVLIRIYAYTARNGLLGRDAAEKYALQSSGSYGVLIGGRVDFLAGLYAVAQSPLIGHGSWARDWHYASQQGRLLRDLGYRTSRDAANSWVIPKHSHLIGAWVDAGFLGAAFWLWILCLAVRLLPHLSTSGDRLAPLIVYLTITLMWDILFSPYGAERRFITPFYIVVLLLSASDNVRGTENFISRDV